MSITEKKIALIGLIIFFGASTVSTFGRELYMISFLTGALVFCFIKVFKDMK